MKPVLSIGIIFKNEIRCLERCLESIQPLREAVPCQLVMADTGSDDGSREIAARYADILFDFPWVDDFAAARNAVMDHCSGEWYLTVDADEWLDGDIRQLAEFFQSDSGRAEDLCGVVVRNYATAALDWNHADFLALRMVRMSTGLRYEGSVHEKWGLEEDHAKIFPLDATVLHHDGYVCLNDGSEEGQEKLRRNMRLLEKRLEQSPDDLMLLVQCAESSGADLEQKLAYLRRAVELVRQKAEKWDTCGPNALRLAACTAGKLRLPEMSEWAALAEEMFPDSIHTTVEIQFDAAQWAWNDADYPEVIRRGLRYLKAAADCRAGRFDVQDLLQSPVNSALLHHETSMRAYIARAQVYESQPEAALETLGTLDYGTMDGEQVETLLKTMLRLHNLSQVDTGPLIRKFWAGIAAPKPSREAADQRRRTFIAVAAGQFMPDCLLEERSRIERNGLVIKYSTLECSDEWKTFNALPAYRYGYTLFLSLAGQCEIGTAAAVMEAGSMGERETLLSSVENWAAFPAPALERALLLGTRFPPLGKTLTIEEMDLLAAGMMRENSPLMELTLRAGWESGDSQALAWARALALAAVQCQDWTRAERGWELSRAFVNVEAAFLPWFYTAEALANLSLLPRLHRFGWCCVQAFRALDGGDTAGYVRLLREGLTQCPNVRPMVEFLLDHLDCIRQTEPELLALARQVQALLAGYPPDDPAVTALKASPAYQRVVHLIEG